MVEIIKGWDAEVKRERRRPPLKNRTCTFPGCTSRHLAKGLCQVHYERMRRNGDPGIGNDKPPVSPSEIAFKPCRRCGGQKPGGTGRLLCDTCRSEQPDLMARKDRARTLRRQYGIGPDDYAAILARQNGSCAICGGPPTGSYRCFDVDHDHVTGTVRGLLCRRCNTGLGYIEAGFHEKALAYLAGGVQIAKS